MNRRLLKHTVYWLVILAFLSLFFGSKWESLILAFYFSCLLLPIAMGTTYFFNLYLVPTFLLTGRYWRFALYFIYMLVVSLYLEMLVALGSFAILADFQPEAVDLEGISIFILGVTLYLIIFVTSFMRLVIQFQNKAHEVETLQSEKAKNQQQHLVIRVDRKNQPVQLDQLIYIESLSDYVKVVTTDGEWSTREKISHLSDKLPQQFIRIHRSFVINRNQVTAYTSTEVTIHGQQLPISRTYKKSVFEVLNSRPLAE